MDFTYTGSGVVNFYGCPKIELDYFYLFKFAIGSEVYDKLSAEKGVLESVIIRKAWYVCDPRTSLTKTLYKDHFNWLHNEYDLCSHSEAIDIVSNYYQKKQDDIDKTLALLNC